jgi:phage protein D/phage baseplate assembly protein gpV
MPAAAKPVASAQVVVDGTPLDNKYMEQLLDVTVRDNLLLPDYALVRLRDPTAENLDSHPLKVGADLEVKLGAVEENTEQSLFKGQIVAFEPEFTEGNCVIAVRAYDRGFRLQGSRKSRTFQNQTAEDMVRKIGQEAGLRPGTVDSTGAVHEYFQQSMETDWEFCWRLATMNDFEFLVQDKQFHFRKRTAEGPAAVLTWGDNLLVFKPRMSGIGQAKSVRLENHDPKARQALTGQANTPDLKGKAKVVQDRARVVGELGGGDVVVANRVVGTGGEANKAAQATLDRIASSFVEADGKALGDAKIRAGATVKIDKVGSFSGEYVLSQTTHTFGGGGQYKSAFVIAGRSGHTFSDLLRGSSNGSGNGGNPSWASSLVIGVVTNNNDPEGMGRVRVKFPALGGDMEGWWARVATINAGNDRGLFMLPQVGDEVVVGFEHDDARRPFVLGSLYTGKEKVPNDLKDAQGRKALFGVKSDEKVHIEGKQAMTLKSDEKMTVEVTKGGQGGTGNFLLDAKGGIEQKATQNFKATAAQSVEVQANQSVTVKGTSSVTVESTGSLKLKGAAIDIEASGPVSVKGAIINLG